MGCWAPASAGVGPGGCCLPCPLHLPPLCHTRCLAAGSCREGTGIRRSPAGCDTQRRTAEETAGTRLYLMEERAGESQLDGETEAGQGRGLTVAPRTVPKVVSPETPARTQARPASTQRAVAGRAGAAIRPRGVLAELVVAAGVGPLGAFVNI